MSRYAGKRFAALLVSVVLVFIGFMLGPKETFGAFSTAIGLMLGSYLAGQSATDYKNAGVPR